MGSPFRCAHLTEPKRYLYAELASAIEARQNCARLTPDNAMHNPEWFDRWTERINDLVDLLPSGSGIDTGTEIDLDRSTGEKIVLYLSFHHMNDGFYSGWTDHTVIVRGIIRLTMGGGYETTGL